MKNYSLYWIHTEDMIDPYSEGYIGITKRDPNQRLNEHLDRNEYITEDVILEILHIGSQEDISNLEAKYRPDSYIGWNKSPGGLTGGRPIGIHTSGWNWSEESKQNRKNQYTGIDNPMYGKTISESQKKAISEANKVSKPYVSRNMKKRAKDGLLPKFGSGKDNPRARKLKVDGIVYETLNDASDALNINRATIAHRCKSTNPKFVLYEYI